MTPSRSVAEVLNHECDCRAGHVPTLRHALENTLGADMPSSLAETHPHLFSDAPVFVERRHAIEMRRLVEAVYRVAALPGYVAATLAYAPPIAAIEQPSLGVFNGFDFHMTPEGPRLIEINTNAGGAMLNAAARVLQPPCCPGESSLLEKRENGGQLEADFVAAFLSDWRLSRANTPLRTIAIVDDDPKTQYLYPEFLLYRQLFERHGYEALIADASALEFSDGTLSFAGRRIDLVYNRLTDFYLDDPNHTAIRNAYESGAVVVTPHPRAHALLANKRNLALLTDADFLRSIGARADDVESLGRSIPRTVLVDGATGNWWATRKDWFFKPLTGFGSRGAYRGDKLTRRVFAEVVRGNYVAQEFSPPSERWRRSGDHRLAFKLDIRAYVHAARTQLFAARLYRGQTTNFRTAGGGFAPVYELNPPTANGQECAERLRS